MKSETQGRGKESWDEKKCEMRGTWIVTRGMRTRQWTEEVEQGWETG